MGLLAEQSRPNPHGNEACRPAGDRECETVIAGEFTAGV